MKLEEKTKSSLTSTNTKSDTIKANNANVEASKPKKVLSKKNSLDDDEKLKKEADNQQTEISEENQTTTDSKDTAISNGIKVAVADTTTLDTAIGAGNSSSTSVTGQSSGISNYAFAGLLGLGAIGIAAAGSSSGGGGHATPSGPATDTTSPTLVTTSRNNPAQTITLTFSENLDPAHLPPSSAFGMSLNNNPIFDAIPMGSSIAIGAANQLVITFPIGTFTAGDTIAIRYTDPSAANDSNALQDTTGNDTANFTTTSFSVIDGYIRNAKIYIDSNNNGVAENSEYTGVVTDENGNFFLPEKRPAGGMIAIGGVNIDTGVANTIELKAPAESSVVTPLTTIIQAYMAANKVDSANAEKAIKAALGISDNIDLLNYDPLAEPSGNTDALAVQKIAASIATIITLAAGTDNAKENTVFNNLVTAIKDANSGASIIDFTDTDTLDKILSNTNISSQTVSDATSAINNASTFEDISDAQSEALDNISPAKPILLGLTDSADTGVKGDAITNISSSIVRVSFDTTATDGTAAVKNDNITIYNGNIPVGTANLTASDILNGYADIPTQLTAGNNSLTAQITDGALHKSTYSTTNNIVLDTTPPNIPSISLVVDTSDGTSGHGNDNITNNANLVFSAAAADVTRTYTINNGAAGSSYIAPTTDGTYTVLVTDTDTAGNSASSSLTFTLKTSITTPTITLTTDSTDGATGHDTDNITNNANLVFSAAAADVTRTYAINNGAATSSYVAPTTDGEYTVLITDTDLAGNVVSSSLTFTLDTSAAAPVWTNATGGVLGSDGVVTTNDSTPAIGGTAEAGVTINVYNALGSASLPEGALLGTVVAGADGKWSLQLPQLPDGDYRAKAEAVDAAGNVSTLAVGPLLRVDASIAAPTITLASDSTDGATGHDADNITNNANLVFSAAAADVTRTYAINNGAAASSYIAPGADGVYTVTVTDTDVAGNVVSSSLTFTLDTSAAAPVWTNATGGVLGSDGVVTTNDSTPAIGGTAEAGVTIHVYNALGSANLAEGALLGTVVAGADGKWSLQLPQLPDGDYRAKAEAVDAAGNVSTLAVGPLLRVDATNSPADSTQPYLVNASFTESDNATITLTFNEPIQIANITPPYMWSGINITGATVTDNTVTLTTNETLTATDTLELNHFDLSQIGIKDLAGNYALYRNTVICGSSDNELAVPYYNSYEIFTGNGADVIKVGERDDVIILTEAIKSSDKVVVNGNDEASTWALMDNVIGFDVSGTVTNDKLDLPTSAIADNTSGFINGVDAGSIKSHSISNGILTFGATDTGTAIVINESNITDVINYLTSNITIPGLAAGIEIDTDANGSVDSLIVYQQQGGDIEDVAIMLSGITGATLGNTAGNNVVEITDSQGPIANYPVISNNTITFSFNEVINSYNLTGLGFKLGNGQSLSDIAVTSASSSGNNVILTTDTAFSANDYVLISDADKYYQFVNDNSGNKADVFYADNGFINAIGGAGNSIIDLSKLTYSDPFIDLTIADLAGGDDTLISGAGGFFELDGGIGNDILDARLSSNADLFGGDGNDILYGAQFSNEYIGGKGADRMIGSSDPQSEDYFLFKQGDSTSVSFTDQGNTGLGNGDTFVFNGGADIILAGLDPLADGAFYGDSISLYSNSYNYNDIDLSKMASIPLDGLVTDQGYFFQQGSYAEASGIFTVNDTGADALIVYDGDSSNGVSQTALVLANTNSAYLATDTWGSIYLDTPPIG